VKTEREMDEFLKQSWPTALAATFVAVVFTAVDRNVDDDSIGTLLGVWTVWAFIVVSLFAVAILNKYVPDEFYDDDPAAAPDDDPRNGLPLKGSL
jgi:hypothetical protein